MKRGVYGGQGSDWYISNVFEELDTVRHPAPPLFSLSHTSHGELDGCSHLIEALTKAAKESGQSVRGSAVDMTDHSAGCRHWQATEYYYDEGAKQLYYFSNATHGAPPTETFVAVRTPHPKHQA